MAETTSISTTAVFQAQFPLAMQALGIHMEAHHLPPFTSIDVRGHTVTVLLNRGTDTAWLSTVEVDDSRHEERSPGGVDAIRSEWDVRLPDTGFKFTLIAYRPVARWIPTAVPA